MKIPRLFSAALLIAFLALTFNNYTLTAETAEEPRPSITLDVKDMDLTDVLRMIADQSGTNIITSKNVKGLITISLQDIPFKKALDAILKVNNCGYIQEDGIIQVYTYAELAQKEQFIKLVTKVFRPEYIRASDIKQTLNSLKSPRGKIETEPKTNTLIVTDTPEYLGSIEDAIKQMDKKLETKIYKLSYAKPVQLQKTLQAIMPATEVDIMVDERTDSLVITASGALLEKIDTLVKSWDRQIPQVLIEAKIMQITLEKNKLLGVDWQFQNPVKHTLTLGPKGLPLPTGAAYIDAFKIGVLGTDDYQVTLRALEKSSDVNLISSPSIVTLDNTEAKILIGSSEPYEVFHFDERGIINGKEIKFVEVGIKLTVVPKISENDFITINIHPEVSSARKGTVSDALAIDTTEATTAMTVKNGNTLVLGGLIKDDKEAHIAKIPLLGDIPILKHAFRTTYYTTVKKEIIIFITPKIVSPEKAAPQEKTSAQNATDVQELKSLVGAMKKKLKKR
ncbi:hypothetical protein EPN16_07960 [bacterium]|nr:MAG: hypothetical protein EPN16_07960 [bacterium]